MTDISVISNLGLARNLPTTTAHGFAFIDAYPNEPDWKSWQGAGAMVFDRSPRAKIELTGPHAAPFLHNLCSNDVKGLAVGDGCELFFADKTARYVGFGNVYHLILSDGRHAFWLDLPVGSGTRMIQHLDKFLVSEQVEFAERTAEFCQFHLAGDGAAKILSFLIQEPMPELANHQHMVRTIDERIPCNIRRNDHLGVPGYDLVMLHSRAQAVWERAIAAGANPMGELAYQGLRIRAGYPDEPAELDGTVRVMEVDRPQTAISDKKGCYLGQEPIVMARDRGQLNRKLRKIRLKGDQLAPGPFTIEGKDAGRLTSLVACEPPGEFLGLAYLRRGYWEENQVRKAESQGQSAEFSVMP